MSDDRASRKTKALFVRVTPERHATVTARAISLGMPTAVYVEHLITKDLEESTKPGEGPK